MMAVLVTIGDRVDESFEDLIRSQPSSLAPPYCEDPRDANTSGPRHCTIGGWSRGPKVLVQLKGNPFIGRKPQLLAEVCFRFVVGR